MTLKTLKKPTMTDDVLAFAEGDNKKKADKGAKQSKSGLVPEGDVRLTANISAERHRLLKYKSADIRRPIGEIVEELIDKYLDKVK